jgi:hypothetical protein
VHPSGLINVSSVGQATKATVVRHKDARRIVLPSQKILLRRGVIRQNTSVESVDKRQTSGNVDNSDLFHQAEIPVEEAKGDRKVRCESGCQLCCGRRLYCKGDSSKSIAAFSWIPRRGAGAAFHKLVVRPFVRLSNIEQHRRLDENHGCN